MGVEKITTCRHTGAGGGYVVRIAGEDGKFVPADAVIERERVVIEN
jgi:hypothetical protein